MARLQSCLRNIFTSNGLLVVNRVCYKHRKNCIIQSTARNKHVLSFTVTNVKNVVSQRNLQLLKLDYKNSYRFSSTGVLVEATLKNASDETSTLRTEAFEEASDSVANGGLRNGTVPAETISDLSNHSNIVIDESLLPPIPVAPGEALKDIDISSSTVELVADALREPTFASLGLNSYWPSGWIQRILEILHVNADLPWWLTIAIVSAGLRILILPLNIKARRHAINLQNNMPHLTYLQMKVTEARQTGNYYDAARYIQEMQEFFKDKKVVSKEAFLPALAQAPIFLSMFYALRSMAKLPVESLKTGGFGWITDLTIPDPYYVLPVIVAGTMYLIIETGVEGNSVNQMTNIWIRYLIKGTPLLIFPFCIFFPAALQCYWVVSNSIALSQVIILKIPQVKSYFSIPDAIKHDVQKYPHLMNQKKGWAAFRENMTNMKLIKEVEDRERLNTVTFEKAGTGPVPRTFKINPKLKNLQDQRG